MSKNSHPKFASLVLAAMAVMGVSTFAAAQNPGQNDPVGPPASYIILRDDNLAFSFISGNDNVFDTYEADLNSPDAVFKTLLTSNKVPSAGVGSSVSVAGRILSQDKDQLVIVGRSGSLPNAIKVRFALGSDTALSNLHDRLADAPDQISVAAGDLDKVPDTDGANHDELVVAYAENSGAVNVAVLNYTTTQATASRLKYLTQAIAPFKVNLNPTAPFKLSEVLAVAIGDFDGDGQNEIALATLDPALPTQVNLVVFRYVHATLAATPELKLITKTSFSNLADRPILGFLPTISLAAGDFTGTGRRAELVLAYRPFDQDDTDYSVYDYLQTISFDDNLNPTLKANNFLFGELISRGTPPDTISPGRILCLPGLINYDPGKGSNLFHRGIVVLYNVDLDPAGGNSQFLQIETWLVGVDQDWMPYPGFDVSTGFYRTVVSNVGVGASFAAAVGGFGVNGNINNPVWSAALEQVRSQGGKLPNQETVSVFQNINGQGLTRDPIAVRSVDSACPISVCDSTTQNALRPAIQAYDYEGKTVLLGAPIKLTVPKLINTDFVLQDPPKHTYWDENAQKVVVVSRMPGSSTVPGTAVSMTNKEGQTYQGKSTDNSGSSIGGSQTATASASIKTDVLGIFKLNLSSEVTAKSTYSYDTNQSSYNGSYSSRLLTESDSTVGDDFISGRFQPLTIWRYRVLGQTGQDSTGKTLNLYYDVVFPGPSTEFKASGLDLDWYQPLQEPGNILSYPAPSNDTFTPADMGTYKIPCPSGATDCNPDGTRTMTGPMIPATEEFLSETAGSVVLNYVGTSSSGKQISYQHKLGTSQDVKLSYSAEVSFLGGQGGGSVAWNTNSDNSFGNTTTSDSTSTSDTAITITHGAISSNEAYAIYPTVYTTLDGTIKVSYAADPLKSASGRSFWKGLYGALPDPALNLPLRFVLSAGQWIVNELPSRKQMRGFFLLSNTPDPVTGQYDILAQAPVAGDKVRLSAQVYNYSTAQSFNNCSVQFYAIKYDSNTDIEQGARQLIGETAISLPPRGTAPAQIIWNTAGFGPASGSASQDYRIYVDLNYKSKINEKYPPEDPAKTYAPMLPAGLDPGQNDEGFGLATVMASSPPSKASPTTPTAKLSSATSISNQESGEASFSSKPLALAMGGRINLLTGNLAVSAGVPVRLRAQVCSTINSRDPVNVVVFDGEPADGEVIAWKRIYVPGNGGCEGTWFSWTPTRGDHNLVATIEAAGALSSIANNALLTTEPSLRRASLRIHVP